MKNGVESASQLAVPIRRRVLVADDDEAVRKSFCRVLRRHHDVEDVADGALVVPLIESGARFDAVLMDLEMPIMNGRLALEALVAVAPGLAKRTLLVTGGARNPELQQWLNELPPERVHRKPVDLTRLLASIERVQDVAGGGLHADRSPTAGAPVLVGRHCART